MSPQSAAEAYELEQLPEGEVEFGAWENVDGHYVCVGYLDEYEVTVSMTLDDFINADPVGPDGRTVEGDLGVWLHRQGIEHGEAARDRLLEGQAA